MGFNNYFGEQSRIDKHYEKQRDCNNCVRHTSGSCAAWKCNGTETIEDVKAEGRKEAIMLVRKLIKIFWKDWNKSSHKKLPYMAFDELDEHILEQADESNGREFMEYYKQLKEKENA